MVSKRHEELLKKYHPAWREERPKEEEPTMAPPPAVERQAVIWANQEEIVPLVYDGRIYDGYVVSSKGKVGRFLPNGDIKYYDGSTNNAVALYDDKEKIVVSIPKAVAEAFLEEPPYPGAQVRRIDPKGDFSAENLKYPDRKKERRKRTGTAAYGTLTDSDCWEFFLLRSSGMKQKEIAERFHCSDSMVGHVLDGRHRPHLLERWLEQGNPPLTVKRKSITKHMTDDELYPIFHLRDNEGLDYTEIAKRIGLEYNPNIWQTVYQIYRGSSRAHLLDRWLREQRSLG